MRKYNILILSNPKSEYAKEDEYIAESFKKDGHIVTLEWIDYDEDLDNNFDVILRRDTWVEDKNDIELFKVLDEKLKDRLKNKNIKVVNMFEIDSFGKGYLIDFYKKGLNVIPSYTSLTDIKNISTVEYVLKPIKSVNSAFGIKFVDKKSLLKEFKEGLIIQPKVKFKSEIQCYFVSNELLYTFEFIPSKYPSYPPPIKINLSDDDKEVLQNIIKETGLKVGFQRIDFLRLENNELLLLEVEATSPFMALDMLDENLRNIVIDKYKKNIYKYIKE